MRVVDIADAENGTKTNYQYRMRERVYVTVFESKSNRQISNCVKVKLLKWVTSATRKRGRTRMKRENGKKNEDYCKDECSSAEDIMASPMHAAARWNKRCEGKTLGGGNIILQLWIIDG